MNFFISEKILAFFEQLIQQFTIQQKFWFHILKLPISNVANVKGFYY